jgi:hypothetical protein
MDNPKLVIELLPGGKINVNGPINDKMLCYAMMELAKDCIREFIARQQQSPIVTAQIVPIQGLNGK